MVRGMDAFTMGHRKDLSWRHSRNDKTYAYLKCNYYKKVVKEVVIRMKEHFLALTRMLHLVPSCWRWWKRRFVHIWRVTISKYLAERHFDDIINVDFYYVSGPNGKDSSSFLPLVSCRRARGPIDQYMNADDAKTEERVPWECLLKMLEAWKHGYMDIGTFFYKNDISFNVATFLVSIWFFQ